jgi:hypothetical protein
MVAGGGSSIDSLRDPIKDEADPSLATGRLRRVNGRTGRVVVAVGILLLLSVGLTALAVSRSSHSGGDPGGLVLHELSPVASAVPSGSTVVSNNKNDAVWSAACPDNPSGRAGWSGVEVLTNFKVVGTTQAIVSAVGASLASQGWTPTIPLDDAAWQYTPLAEWTRSLPGTTSAKVVLFRYPQNVGPSSAVPGSAWMLGAEGRTPGYALPGC